MGGAEKILGIWKDCGGLQPMSPLLLRLWQLTISIFGVEPARGLVVRAFASQSVDPCSLHSSSQNKRLKKLVFTASPLDLQH